MQKPKEGDMYITRLERDLYGAIRILKTGTLDFAGDAVCLLIATTRYISYEKPTLDSDQVKEILIQNRFSLENKMTVGIYTEGIINQFEYLGNLSPGNEEKKLQLKIGDGVNGGFPLCGPVPEDIGRDAFYEWRWEHERDTFIREAEERSAQSRRRWKSRSMKPKQMLEEITFWDMISKLDWDAEDDDAVTEPLIRFLSEQKATVIKRFEETLAHKLYLLDTRKHAMHIGEEAYRNDEDHFSADYFLYVRCATVVSGQQFYQDALDHPEKMPKDKDFESLLTVSSLAYERKMKKDFDYTTGCDYETFSNVKGWE